MSTGTERSGTLLLVDDEAGIRHGLTKLFSRAGFTVCATDDAAEAVRILRERPVDAAVLDVRLRGDTGGIELLGELKGLEPELTVVMITGYGSIDSAVTAMKAGAADYVLKPIDNENLVEAVRRNLELARLRRENRYLKKELLSNLYRHDLITCSENMRALVRTADRVKDSTATVLLTGESGTGKEVLARYIHFTGSRRERAFVCVNCASLSESLLLSELFGHERGAFTGAVDRKRGKFELADGGTLFLDEIGDMSPDTQAKLLRVLEENAFERVGGTKRIEVDVRLITATNRDLRALITEGRFREDLYYRIHVIALDLPPLRERPEDIPLLIDHFVRKYNERYGRRVKGFRPESLQAMLDCSWPGNVRELQNVVNQAVLLADGEYVSAPPGFAGGTVPAEPPEMERVPGDCFLQAGSSVPAVPAGGMPLMEALRGVQDFYEEKIIRETLRKAGGNKSKASRMLGITRKTLSRKMARHRLT